MNPYMKLIIVCMLLAANNLFAQQAAVDSTGLPGDNFSLQGALQMFKESKSLEEFEKKLNTANNHVNNLDLNGDSKTDYIRVDDKTQGSSHAIVLKDDINQNETQDVAVIEIEKDGKESAMLQIVGDKELYGDSVFVEPVDQSDASPVKKGPNSAVNGVQFMFVNVWFWPCVGFMYDPFYVPWVSPWRWHYYPGWWSPWAPMGWGMYHPYCIYYHTWYRPVYEHRVMMADGVYQPYRSTSSYVANRYQSAHTQYNAHRQSNYQNQMNSPKPGNNIKPANNIKPINKQMNNKPGNFNQGNQQQMNSKPGNNKQGNFKQGNDKQINNKAGNEKQINNKQEKGNRKQAKQQKRQEKQNKQHKNKE